MTDSFFWHIQSLERHLSNGEVFVISWEFEGVRSAPDINGEEQALYSAAVSGKTPVGPAGSEGFIPYKELTEDLIISWLEAALKENNQNKIEELKASLVSVLNEKEKPTIGYGLPWAPSPNDCANVTCPPGYYCHEGACIPSEPAPPVPCALITCPPGTHCELGVCVPD